MNEIDKIVKENDFEGLFRLKDNDDFNVALLFLLSNKCNYNPDELNSVQKNLFLSMQIENAGQADSILTFLQEEFPKFKHDVLVALNEIGAFKSAEIIKKAIELLPADDSWFFDSSNEESEKIMAKLDSEFSDYPDGNMCDLYREYAELNRDAFFGDGNE